MINRVEPRNGVVSHWPPGGLLLLSRTPRKDRDSDGVQRRLQRRSGLGPKSRSADRCLDRHCGENQCSGPSSKSAPALIQRLHAPFIRVAIHRETYRWAELVPLTNTGPIVLIPAVFVASRQKIVAGLRRQELPTTGTLDWGRDRCVRRDKRGCADRRRNRKCQGSALRQLRPAAN